MNIKIVGAILILAGCGGVGFSMVSAHRKKELAHMQLIRAIEYMTNQLEYQMTPLPQLCGQVGNHVRGIIGQVFQALQKQLCQQGAPDVAGCMAIAVASLPTLQDSVAQQLLRLGDVMGRFDLPGQLAGLESAKQLVQRDLDGLQMDRDIRLRNYQTLGLCAGAALVILFI